ncbi:MAG: hypothetical protein KAJ75_09390 [Alphaproteobacteria bacterium]|nr:hypothetical protein [Alphaproteobacteria bacterium]
MMQKILMLLACITILSGTVKADELEQRTAVSASELTKFLDDWSKYTAWLDRKGLNEQAGFNESLTEAYHYSKKEIEWVEKHDWSIDRFFYVKSRVIAGIRSVHMKQKQQVVIEMLKKQKINAIRNSSMSEATRGLLVNGIDASIAKAERSILLEGLTMAEFEMIEPEIEVIMKIMGY